MKKKQLNQKKRTMVHFNFDKMSDAQKAKFHNAWLMVDDHGLDDGFVIRVRPFPPALRSNDEISVDALMSMGQDKDGLYHYYMFINPDSDITELSQALKHELVHALQMQEGRFPMGFQGVPKPKDLVALFYLAEAEAYAKTVDFSYEMAQSNPQLSHLWLRTREKIYEPAMLYEQVRENGGTRAEAFSAALHGFYLSPLLREGVAANALNQYEQILENCQQIAHEEVDWDIIKNDVLFHGKTLAELMPEFNSHKGYYCGIDRNLEENYIELQDVLGDHIPDDDFWDAQGFAPSEDDFNAHYDRIRLKDSNHLVVLGLNGSIIPTDSLFAKICVDTCKFHGLDVSFDDLVGDYAHKSVSDKIKLAFEQSGKDYDADLAADIREELREKKKALYQSPMLRRFDDVEKMIKHIRKSGYHLATEARLPQSLMAKALNAPSIKLASNISAEHQFSSVDLLKSGVISAPKPSGELYIHMAKHYNVPAERCIIIGNDPHDADAAGNAGMSFIGFIDPAHTSHAKRQALIERGAVAVFDNFKDLDRFLFSSKGDGDKPRLHSMKSRSTPTINN